MARVTNLELTQLLAARNAEIEGLRMQLADLQGQLLAARGNAPSVKRSAYTPRPADPGVLARRAAMAAAKEQAMATGQVVRV